MNLWLVHLIYRNVRVNDIIQWFICWKDHLYSIMRKRISIIVCQKHLFYFFLIIDFTIYRQYLNCSYEDNYELLKYFLHALRYNYHLNGYFLLHSMSKTVFGIITFSCRKCTQSYHALHYIMQHLKRVADIKGNKQKLCNSTNASII